MYPDHLITLIGTLVAVTDSTVDEYGDATEATAERQVYYWVDNPTQAEGRDGSWVDSDRRLFFRAGTTIGQTDRFLDRDGVEWSLDSVHEHIHPLTGDVVMVTARAHRRS